MVFKFSNTMAFQAQQEAMEAAMQADVDAHAPAPGAPGGLLLPPPGTQQQMPPAMFQTFMQQFMQMMWSQMQQQPPSTQAAPVGQAAGSAPAAFSPQGAGHWREDGHMANVRLDD